MTSWYNNENFSFPPNSYNDSNVNQQILPPTAHSLPLPQPSHFIPPMIPPPPLPPTFQNIPPPICNVSLPPPPFPTLPNPPVPGFFPPALVTNDPSKVHEDKFDTLKKELQTKYKHIEKQKKHTNFPKISDLKQTFVKCFKLIEQLESLMNCLQITQKSLSNDEWLGCCKEVEILKEELSGLLEKITDPNHVNLMKRIVNLRQKKRQYKRRKIKEWKEQKLEAKFYSEQENRRIDLWLDKMKDQVSRVKREEDIKREADLVLSDVTAKKAEAKRMLNMLNSLSKLRTARAHNLPAGKSVSEHETKAFAEVIERLKKMWLEQFNGYKVEEEGLKVMLGHAEEERASIEAGVLRKNLKAWSQGIFGTSHFPQPLPFDELVQIRHDWDKFICAGDTPMASSIPVGWILPSQPKSEEWAKFLNSS